MHNINLIKQTIVSAGKLALEYYLRVKPAWKEDHSYVTDGDLAVQAYLKTFFETHFPEDGIIAEENGLKKAPTSGNRTWVIDPIDGTASFSAGLPIWGIAIGLVEDGRPSAGFFYQPVTGDLFYSTTSGQVFRNDQAHPMRSPTPFHRETSLFIASRLHRYYRISPAYPGKLRNLASSMAHLSYVATGSADAALVERVHVWDVAAGMAMLSHNGGVLRYLNGEDVDLTALFDGRAAPYPMLAGHPDTVAAFAEIIEYNGKE